MSYAAVTAKNAHQTPEEARAPPVPEVQHDTASTASLVDVDSPHVSSVPSSFASQEVKTSTQADRLDREAHDDEVRAKAEHAHAHARQHAKDAKNAKEKAKSKARIGGKRLKDNADNPVIVGNALLTMALGGTLGYTAYVKHRAGELTWRVVGLGVAIVGAFSVADYYASMYLFKKYPLKK